MSCHKDFENAIWEAAETGSVPIELERHIEECPECRRSLESLTCAMSGFKLLKHVESPDPSDVVYARLAKSAPVFGRIWAWGGALATACLLIVLFLCQPPKHHTIKQVEVTMRKPTVQAKSQPPKPSITAPEVIHTPVPTHTRRQVARANVVHHRHISTADKIIPRAYTHPESKPMPDAEVSDDRIVVRTVTVMVPVDVTNDPDNPESPQQVVRVVKMLQYEPLQDGILSIHSEGSAN